MSHVQPPAGPPSEPEAGAEILDSHDGEALSPTRSRRPARTGLLVGGGVLALAVVGGGAWAATSFFSTGAQPAEALPATTLGYLSIDLDPSGGQKIEALRTLDKFPGFADQVGVKPDGDIRAKIFSEALDSGGCDGVDYARDVEPWLGQRAAVAAVPGADGKPAVAVALQVSDADEADTGLTKLRGCGDADGSDDFAWVIDGDWAVLAETKALAQATVSATQKASLADDADYQRWTGEAGEPGIVTMYAAPGAGEALLENGFGGTAVPEATKSQLEKFQGFAAVVRFADGAFEMEGAGDSGSTNLEADSDVAARVATLPDDTGAVLGLSLSDDWFDQTLDQFAGGFADEDGDALSSQIEGQTGLSLPEDAQTLTQGGLVLSAGSGIDPEAVVNAAGPDQLPVALELGGDTDAIEAVVAKLQALVGDSILGTTTTDDAVVVGPDEAYRESVAEGGHLGDSATFTGVVVNPDSPAIFYLDVDAFSKFIDSFDDEELSANLEPLDAIGMSGRVDGDISRFTIRASTD